MTTSRLVCPAPESAVEPAFLRALDRDAIADLAQRHLANGAEIVALHPEYVRWKELDGSLVGYRATVRAGDRTVDSWVTVRTAPPHRLAAEAERLQHRADEEWCGLEGLALVPEANLLLVGFPLDRAMHDLRRLVRPSKVRSLVAAACPELVPTGMRFSKSRSSFRLVRYKPERRAVLHWQIGCIATDGKAQARTSVWLRCHAEPVARRAVAATSQAIAAGIACPRTLGIAHDRLTIESHVDGTNWTPASGARAFDLAANATARLHACKPDHGLPHHGPVHELDRALRAAEDLGRLSVATGQQARALADRLAAQVPAAGLHGFAHGDLHMGQVLLREQDAALCDFDRACVAPAALDLATFHAHCVLHEGDAGHATAGAFLAAYARHRELPPAAELAWWTASALLRAATLPFRMLRPDWPQATAQLVALAQARLADPTAAEVSS